VIGISRLLLKQSPFNHQLETAALKGSCRSNRHRNGAEVAARLL